MTNLIEKPTAVLGGFNPDFLGLPRDVLIGTMKKHQRYFPITNSQSTNLLPNFIAIRNGDAEHLEIVKEGNEHVLGARFADANFFVREDVKFPLEHYRDGLKTLTFQTKLGSVLDKSERMLKLAAELGQLLGFSADELATLQRATFLAKADLTTQMVTEMTSLQGIIGREYALRTGEAAAVATAIGEQYQPVPQSKVGVVVALADRIDSLVGLFAAGLAPTGTKDPFGLRRAAIGTVQPLIEHDLDFDLRTAIEKSAATQPLPVSGEVQAQVLEFLTGRPRVVLTEAGIRHDVVEAVLAEQSHNPAASARAMKQLMDWVKRPNWTPLLDGYARCVRIVRSQAGDGGPRTVDEGRLVEAAEKALYQAFKTSVLRPPASVADLLNAVETLLPAITEFFDKVLVMAEDPAVKANRLGLLQQISGLAGGIADLSKLEGF